MKMKSLLKFQVSSNSISRLFLMVLELRNVQHGGVLALVTVAMLNAE